jgi:hypothetical protein
MTKWLTALFSETIISVWWILSGLSTLSTFFIPSWAGRWRLVSAISAVIGFAVANFKVFRKQESRISTLEKALASHTERRSQLKISSDDGSRYILQPVMPDVRHADFNGGYFEFHLMIENGGPRNSTVNNYRVEIVELGSVFTNLQPIEGRNGAQGRHSHQGFYPPDILSRQGIIQIDAENATGHGTLLFFIPDINMQQFVNAGLHMQAPERRFGNLRCRLTLTDTTQSSGTQEFELFEA